jgi:hypothetical protein
LRARGAAIVVGAACALLAGLAPAAAQEPVVIDRILSRPNGEILTQSDVWQAIELRLLPPGSRTPDAALRGLENRRLVLAEVNRLPVVEPDPSAVAARRAEWTTELIAAGARPPDLMARFGMTDDALQAWFRNDLRIADYLDERFAATPEAEREAAVEEWIVFLRERAGMR